MNVWNRIAVILLISIPTIAIDQVTKLIATKHLENNATQTFLYDTFRLTYAENIGAFLGLGNNMSSEFRFAILVIMVSVILISLLIYMLQNDKQDISSLIYLSLILSGGVSNLYDRLFNNGAVVDFLNMGIGNLRTGIFNVADMAILLGVVCIFILPIKKEAT